MDLRRATPIFALVVAACGGAGPSAFGSPDLAPGSSEPPSADGPATPAVPQAPTATKPEPGEPPSAPAGLACLSTLYGGAPTQPFAGSGWSLKLPDGTALPWDDDKAKTFDQTLNDPDLGDMFSLPYATGPIAPVTTVNFDPGRFRQEALFKATYGDSAASVQSKLVDVDFVGQTLKFHSRAAAALGRVSAKLKTLVAQTPALSAYVTGELGGTFAWRPILNTNRMSAHSYGIAIDVVVSKSNYWEWEKKPDGSLVWTNRIPQAIVDAFESEGFAWGGRWYHYDTMHFEYRPELFDPACR